MAKIKKEKITKLEAEKLAENAEDIELTEEEIKDNLESAEILEVVDVLCTPDGKLAEGWAIVGTAPNGRSIINKGDGTTFVDYDPTENLPENL